MQQKALPKSMRSLNCSLYSMLALVLLVVFIFLPVGPVFADTQTVREPIVVEQNFVMDENVAIEASEMPQESDDVSKDNTTRAIDKILDTQETNGEIIVSSDYGSVLNEVLIQDEVDNMEETLSEDLVENHATNSDSAYTQTVSEVLISVSSSITEAVILEEGVSVDTDGDTNVSIHIDDMGPNLNITEVHSVTNNENRYTFSKDACTFAGDGVFYCVESSGDVAPHNMDRVFSAPDSDGDKEIYVEKGGKIFAITSNTFDDDAPYYDEVSNTIVWHRLIDGRYQIISYDVNSKTETQITRERYNNMEPSRFGDVTVWQGWIGNNWEIFLLKDGVRTMITNNTTQDITPIINGTHVVWQSFEGGVWHMKVYDIYTGIIQTIEDSSGGSIENLRFVLVYDTKFETGDVETKGYDLHSGSVLTLGVQPTSVPDKLPDPEQTGEDRALVTSSNGQPKTKVVNEVDDDNDENTDDDIKIGETDLIVPSFIDSGEDSILRVDREDQLISSPVPDIVIPSIVDDTEDSVEDIPDLIIDSLIKSTLPNTDSQ